MSKRVLVLAAVVVLVFTGAVDAKTRAITAKPTQDLTPTVRSNGALGSISTAGSWTGALEGTIDVTVTTTNGANATALNLVLILNQIYNGYWATATWTSINTEFLPNSAGLGTFVSSIAYSVPAAGTYLGWGYGWAGVYSGTTTGGAYCPAPYICRTQSPITCCYGTQSAGLFEIYSSAPPTATPDPSAGGIPVPTMNQWGMAAMIILLIGVAMLIITRRS